MKNIFSMCLIVNLVLATKLQVKNEKILLTQLQEKVEKERQVFQEIKKQLTISKAKKIKQSDTNRVLFLSKREEEKRTSTIDNWFNVGGTSNAIIELCLEKLSPKLENIFSNGCNVFTTAERVTQNISEKISNSGEFRSNNQMGILIRDQNHLDSDPALPLNLTRKDRKNLIKQLKEAEEMMEFISLAREQYAVCSGFQHQLQKTAELLDTYHQEVSEAYRRIYNVIHGQTNEFSRADLVTSLQGINETLKKQVRDELEKFAPIRDVDF